MEQKEIKYLLKELPNYAKKIQSYSEKIRMVGYLDDGVSIENMIDEIEHKERIMKK